MFNTLVSISHVHFIIVDAAHFDFPREKILHLLLHLACSERLNNIYRICPATKSISLFFFFFFTLRNWSPRNSNFFSFFRNNILPIPSRKTIHNEMAKRHLKFRFSKIQAWRKVGKVTITISL